MELVHTYWLHYILTCRNVFRVFNRFPWRCKENKSKPNAPAKHLLPSKCSKIVMFGFWKKERRFARQAKRPPNQFTCPSTTLKTGRTRERCCGCKHCGSWVSWKSTDTEMLTACSKQFIHEQICMPFSHLKVGRTRERPCGCKHWGCWVS